MYVPLQVGVFFPLLFFLKVAFPCFDAMCYNFILLVFSFCFHMKKRIFLDVRVSIQFSVAASRVPSREDVLQPYNENSASLLEKLRNKIFRLAISGHLLFKCNVRKGLQEKYNKNNGKTLQSRVIR